MGGDAVCGDTVGGDNTGMTSPAQIVVVGSVNMDLTVHTSALPAPGETVLGTSLSQQAGGKGRNQAVAAAKAGAQVAMIGAVGSDQWAEPLVSSLAEAGVRTDLVRRTPGESGVAVVTVDDDAENSIVVIPGANSSLTELTAADCEALAGARLIMCQLEIPLECVIAAAQTAHAAGIPVLLNPSPVMELPAELLAAVDILVLNEVEAGVIGSDATGAVPTVVTTLGARGARYRGPGVQTAAVTAPQVNPVDTTGAGDAFTGALAAALIAGTALPEAVRRACAAGALATLTRGAADAAPSRAEIDEMLAHMAAARQEEPTD